ncbi:hypothetical protein [Mesorhizobium sp. SP-1A]|uniref:hypothetical protein n=1 Tax=Mesorhizobium sp. SP-1A TaxID=3077840 RepID=UPI0028F6EBD3|nr:hypothetical protein [Mesorhizobium sp. SP-1A]
MLDIEKEQGFDRAKAEAAIDEYIISKLTLPLETFESNTPGVIAFERPSYIDEDKIDFDELAEFVSARVGIEVVSIGHCDWTFDDDCDEEAVAVAFDIPALEPEYRDVHGNLISREASPTP